MRMSSLLDILRFRKPVLPVDRRSAALALAAGHGLGAPGSQDGGQDVDAGDDDLCGLWIDDPLQLDARRAGTPEDLVPHLDEFVRSGFTIFRGAVPPALVDAVVAHTQSFGERPEAVVLKCQGAYIDPVGHASLRKGDRIVDLYATSADVRTAIYSPQIKRFLRLVFDDDPIAMQSISFEFGSQQPMHQDTAYVVSERPLCLAATWMALEDIEEGSGELMYYPGSHRFGHFLFSGRHKNWKRSRDGDSAHAGFLGQLHSQASERGIREERFLARKGDVLVWHADLAHGGSPIRVEGRTRRSLVTHFCPRSIKPAYRRMIPQHYLEFEHEPHCCFTSRHYDLGRMVDGSAPIIYDGGVSKRRLQAQQTPPVTEP